MRKWSKKNAGGVSGACAGALELFDGAMPRERAVGRIAEIVDRTNKSETREVAGDSFNSSLNDRAFRLPLF